MDISDLIAVIAVIVAFLSMGAQIYVGKRGVGTNLYQHVNSLFNSIIVPFLEYPDLREFFYENKYPDNLNAQSYQRVFVIAEMILDTFEWVEHDIKKAKRKDKESWQDYMLSVYSSSPIMREYHEKNPKWHPLFNKLIQKTEKVEKRANEKQN